MEPQERSHGCGDVGDMKEVRGCHCRCLGEVFQAKNSKCKGPEIGLLEGTCLTICAFWNELGSKAIGMWVR